MSEESEKLNCLAERCEAVRPRDPLEMAMLNKDILITLGWTADRFGAIDPNGVGTLRIPSYVTSLDDSISLIPEGWLTLKAGQDHDGAEWRWEIYPAFNASNSVWAQCSSAALAVAAASLRARATPNTEGRTPMSEKVSDWLQWAGGSCPVPLWARVDVEMRNGSRYLRRKASDWMRIGDSRSYWRHEPKDSRNDIVAYRVRHEQE